MQVDRQTVNEWSKEAHRALTTSKPGYDFTDVLLAIAQRAAEAERKAFAKIAGAELRRLHTRVAELEAQPARAPLTDEQIQDLIGFGDPTEQECYLVRLGWDAARGTTKEKQG